MLSSDDLTSERFSVVRRGYDMTEVESFLDSHEKEWSSTLATAQSKISELEAALAEARSKEEAVHLTLLAATKTKDELLTAAQRKLDEATAQAEEQSEKILSDAKFEAYRLVNDAKELADRAVSEARAEASSAAEHARREAEAELTALHEETARLKEQRRQELEDMRRRFEAEHGETARRVEQLKTVALDLEERLRAIASGNLEAIADITGRLRHTPGTATTDTPDQDHMVAHDEETSHEAAEGEPHRGSFYSRRSARLPRIGDDAANGVLAAVGAMRARVIEAEAGPDAFEADSETSALEPEMAVRTA